jgi:diketogulonate reductase-like aldo/keto reductase
MDSLHVVNLRLMRGSRPDSLFDDQLAAMTAARDDGLIGTVGLSNVTLPHLLHALKFIEIACVQNGYHPVDRSSQPVLEECTRRAIAFVPFSPLGSGSRGVGSALGARGVRPVAARLDCSPAQVVLAWALRAAPNILLIPGTASRAHLRENLDAAKVTLDATRFGTCRIYNVNGRTPHTTRSPLAERMNEEVPALPTPPRGRPSIHVRVTTRDAYRATPRRAIVAGWPP